MVKPITQFVCQSCGASFPKWQGQCTQCGEWNSLVESVLPSKKSSNKNASSSIGEPVKILKFSEIKAKKFSRIDTKIEELNRVLGGGSLSAEAGIVPGSLVLVAGAPGIGKSTLLTQLALNMVRAKKAVCYICGEESPSQIKIRIQRLTKGENLDSLSFLAEVNIENILASVAKAQSAIDLIIVDSIQTLWSEQLTGVAGSVGQVRYCANILLNFAKKADIPIFLIGHVTKEGMIAGPKVLEHLVDTVLYLEGDKNHDFRILRAVKNRFGPTDEVGIFQMNDNGMNQVTNPSEVFLGDSKGRELVAGSATVVTMQGVRPILVEIQALVVPTTLVIPRRVSSGVDYSRLQVITAVLQKRLGIPLYQHDIFVNVAGGFKITEPAADLAIALAITSSFKNKPLPAKTAAIGELGLLGEIRRVSFMEKRIKEAKKLGFTKVIGQTEKWLNQVLRFLK